MSEFDDIPPGFEIVNDFSDIPEGFAVKPRTLSEEVLRGLGLTGRFVAEGVADTAGIVTNPIGFVANRASNAVGGPDISSENLGGDVSAILTRLGVPEPQGRAEKIGGAINRAVVGGAGFMGAGRALANTATNTVARNVGTNLAAEPGVQALSFGAAGGAVEALPEDTHPAGKLAVGFGAAAVPAVGNALLRQTAAGIPGAVNTAEEAATLRSAIDVSAPHPTSTSIPEPTVGRPTLSAAVASDAPVDVTPPVSSEQIVAQLRKGNTQSVVDAVVPDAKIVESAQRLGVDLNPEHYSTNAAFQDVARALKSQPGSTLQANEVSALSAVAKKADDLVTANNGFLDKSEFSAEIGSQIGTTIDDLAKQAKLAYKAVNEAIPAQTRVDTTLIRQHLEQKLADFGGDKSQLSKVEKQLLSLTNEANPTYATLDNVRRNVGEGFNRRSGPFKDGADANLREVYGLLSEVQNGVARAFGVGDLYAGARGLVVSRKAIEDQAVQLFGRNASGSLVPKIRGSATALVAGDVSKFNQLISAVPKNRRGEAAATVLSEIFSGGSRRGGELGTGFAASFKALNRNKAAKDLLFSHLPDGARQRFDDIGRVLTGIVDSNRKPLSNPSGSAGPIIKALQDLSVFEKVLTAVPKIAAAEGVSLTVGLPGAGTAGMIGSILSKQRTPVIVAADQMISSPAFTRAVLQANRGNPAEANRIVQGSAAYNNWISKLDSQTAELITRVGFFEWASDNGR